MNLTVLQDTFNGDEQLVGSAIKEMIEVLNDDGNQLSEAVRKGTASEVVTIAHRLKFSFIMIQHGQAVALCRKIKDNSGEKHDHIIRLGKELLNSITNTKEQLEQFNTPK